MSKYDFLEPGEEPRGYLRETQNFLDLFLYTRNRDKGVPEAWYTWVALSVLAACVSNRVWISPEPNNPIYPNLYIILLGPSGSGKGQAISHGTKLISPGATDVRELLGYFPGGTSDKALKDYLLSHLAGDGLSSHAWVIASELADSVGGPNQARQLVVALTNMYTGELDEIKDNTRQWGLKSVPRACVNFLAGSTEIWFVESIGLSVAEGGFLARSFVVPGQQTIRRTARNTVPPDFQYIYEHLQQRLYKYLQVNGEFLLSPDAFQILDYWLRTRTLPESPDLLPSFARSEVQVYKLAMLLSLADSLDLEISADHMRDAIRMYEGVKRLELDVLNYMAQEPDAKKLKYAREILRRAGRKGLSNTEWNKLLQDRGIVYRKARELIASLEVSGQACPTILERPPGTAGRKKVHWYWYEHFLQQQLVEGSEDATNTGPLNITSLGAEESPGHNNSETSSSVSPRDARPAKTFSSSSVEETQTNDPPTEGA